MTPDQNQILPSSSRFQFSSGLQICRILNGMWQVSGAHGSIEPRAAVDGMFPYLDSGFTTWDLADHYGPAEDFIGEFRRRLSSDRGPQASQNIQALTKWVPQPGPMDRGWVEKNVDISLRRMGVESLDLLQFHWWDYRDPRYLEAMSHLSDFLHEGKIQHLGLTNFDTQHVQELVTQGYPVSSNQVQFSLIDDRPEVGMAPFCSEEGIHILAYGVLAGGLLTERFLRQPEPGRADLNTASLAKYKRMVDAWGGWELFQELLAALEVIGGRRRVSIADVALRYVLDRPAVAGVIIGARLGLSDHRKDNGRVFQFSLESDDLELIESVTSRSKDLYQIIGDCGDEYR